MGEHLRKSLQTFLVRQEESLHTAATCTYGEKAADFAQDRKVVRSDAASAASHFGERVAVKVKQPHF